MTARKPIPDYYPTMFLDGYEPWEILAAAHDKMIAAADRNPAAGGGLQHQHQDRNEGDEMSRTDDEKKKKDKKKRESDLEKMIFAIMEKSMKDALN